MFWDSPQQFQNSPIFLLDNGLPRSLATNYQGERCELLTVNGLPKGKDGTVPIFSGRPQSGKRNRRYEVVSHAKGG